MKRYFIYLASALMMLSFYSCKKETPKPEPKPNPEPEKSKECKLISFVVKGGGTLEITGEIYEEDKVVELVYVPEEFAEFSNMTATVKISDKATISPDPATVKDFSKDQKFTITAEDGKTKAEWTVKPTLAKMTVKIAEKLKKPLSELGIENFAKFAGNAIAFCAADKFAGTNKVVYNLDGTKAGELNLTGMVANPTIVTLANDNKGRLVAAVGYNDDSYTTPCENANDIKSSNFWIWKDGWDKAPTKIYENPANVAMFMNVGGDFDNNMIMMAPSPARNCNFHTWVFENGVLQGGKWQWFKTGSADEAPALSQITAMQGPKAGENVCPMDGTKEGTFVWAHALPKITEAAGGWNRNGGSIVAKREGIEGTDNIHMRGTLWPDKLVAKEQHGGIWGFGNVEICANIKGFTFNGIDYVAVAHVGWQAAYFTVPDMTNSTEPATPNSTNGETKYLLKTQKVCDITGAVPSVAYVYDKSKDTGHVLALFSIGSDLSGIPHLVHYEITREKI